MTTKLQELEDMTLAKYKSYLSKEEVSVLLKLRQQSADLYHNSGDSPLSDDRYDMLVDELKKRQKNFAPPVGAKLRQGENRVKIPYWLGSADKITPEEPEELERWLEKNPAKEYIVSDKLDGVSCLYVKTGNNVNLYTRGDGEIGADISYLISYFDIPEIKEKNFAVRGELILTKKIFADKYKNTAVNGRTYKNPRNMVAGLIGGKTARQGLSDISFVVYEIVGDSMPKPSVQLVDLAQMGFTVVKYKKISKKDMTTAGLSEILLDRKKSSPYEIDGIIIQSDAPYDRNTDGNPDYLFAFKMLMSEDIYQTTVKRVQWDVSKWGYLKPVVILQPVQAHDVTISKATAHNAKYVMDNKLGPGAIIKVTRSKDVIPYILEIVKPAKNAQMPEVAFSWDANKVNIMVKEYQDTICVKLISSFFAKLGIKHVSEATVQKMFANGLDNLLKIVSASKQRLLQVPEFQDKSAQRIYTNIRAGLTGVKLSTVLGASGIFGFGVGTKRVEELLRVYPNLLDMHKKDKKTIKDSILQVEGFSDIMADKIVANLKYADMFVKELGKYATFKTEARVSDSLAGKKFVMTGFRDKKMEEDILSRGGKVTGTVSGNTSVLIVAKLADKSTTKSAKAMKLGVPVMTKEEFVQRYLS